MTAAPRKTTARKRVADKPAPVALNLDTYAAEVDEIGPFAFVHEGRRYVLRSPYDFGLAELDHMEAADRDPRELFKSTMTEADWTVFHASNPPMRKVKVLVEAYYAHYGYSPEMLGNTAASRT